MPEYGSEGFRVRLRRLSEYGSVACLFERPTRETQAEQYSDNALKSIKKESGHVRPRQGTEICNFGAPSPLEALHRIFCFCSSIYVQFSKTSPLKSGESSEKSSGENRVKSCHVCGCHGFFGPERTHKGIWWSGCLGSVPVTVLGPGYEDHHGTVFLDGSAGATTLACGSVRQGPADISSSECTVSQRRSWSPQ